MKESLAGISLLAGGLPASGIKAGRSSGAARVELRNKLKDLMYSRRNEKPPAQKIPKVESKQ